MWYKNVIMLISINCRNRTYKLLEAHTTYILPSTAFLFFHLFFWFATPHFSLYSSHSNNFRQERMFKNLTFWHFSKLKTHSHFQLETPFKFYCYYYKLLFIFSKYSTVFEAWPYLSYNGRWLEITSHSFSNSSQSLKLTFTRIRTFSYELHFFTSQPQLKDS